MSDRLTPEAIILLNRLGADENFAWFKTNAGFSPRDKIDNPKLGDYLDSLTAAAAGSGFFGFISPPTLVASADSVSDEFDATSLDSSWTRFHTIDTTAIHRGQGYVSPSNSARESFSTLRPGWLLFQPCGIAGYHKSLGSGDVLTDAATLYCRFSMDSNEASDGDSLQFAMSETASDTIDTDNAVIVTLGRATANNTWTLSATRKVAGSSADIYAATSLSSFGQPIQGMGVSYFLNEGSMTFLPFAILDNGCWKSLGSFSSVALRPDRLAVIGTQASQANPVFGLDYVRRESGLFLTK